MIISPVDEGVANSRLISTFFNVHSTVRFQALFMALLRLGVASER